MGMYFTWVQISMSSDVASATADLRTRLANLTNVSANSCRAAEVSRDICQICQHSMQTTRAFLQFRQHSPWVCQGVPRNLPNLHEICRICAKITKFVGNKRGCKSIVFAKFPQNVRPPLLRYLLFLSEKKHRGRSAHHGPGFESGRRASASRSATDCRA